METFLYPFVNWTCYNMYIWKVLYDKETGCLSDLSLFDEEKDTMVREMFRPDSMSKHYILDDKDFNIAKNYIDIFFN